MDNLGCGTWKLETRRGSPSGRKMVAQCVSAGTTAEFEISPGTGRKGLRFRRGLPSGILRPVPGLSHLVPGSQRLRTGLPSYAPAGAWPLCSKSPGAGGRPGNPAILVCIGGARTLVSRPRSPIADSFFMLHSIQGFLAPWRRHLNLSAAQPFPRRPRGIPPCPSSRWAS